MEDLLIVIKKKNRVNCSGDVVDVNMNISLRLNPFPTKDVYIRPPWCHATTKDVYIRPRTNGIAQSPVVRYCLNTFTPVVEKSLALIFEDR